MKSGVEGVLLTELARKNACQFVTNLTHRNLLVPGKIYDSKNQGRDRENKVRQEGVEAGSRECKERVAKSQEKKKKK